MSEARLEFNNLWISYDVLHDRLDEKVNRDRLSGDGKLLMVFFILWTLFMASYDYSTGWRAASDLAVLESLVHPRFPSSQSSSFKTATATAQSRKFGSSSNNSFSSATTPKFISFHDIQSIEDYNTWLEDVFLEEMYFDPVYDAMTKREKSIQLQDQQSILWGVAIRQHRVAPVIGGGGNSGGNLATGGSGSGCCVPKEMQDQIQCHPSYGHFGGTFMFPVLMCTHCCFDVYSLFGLLLCIYLFIFSCLNVFAGCPDVLTRRQSIQFTNCDKYKGIWSMVLR